MNRLVVMRRSTGLGRNRCVGSLHDRPAANVNNRVVSISEQLSSTGLALGSSLLSVHVIAPDYLSSFFIMLCLHNIRRLIFP